MKIEVIKILNLSEDGATSTMLIFDNKIHILLDCGIGKNLNEYIKYEEKKELIKKTDFILISHSSLNHTGGLFYIFEFFERDKKPDIFSTSPI
jgi:Cft2 family RNA processing exonuclease